MLAAYLEDPNLASWGGRAMFVLVGRCPPALDVEALPGLFLWTVPPSDLAQIVDSQGRGTINSETLEGLTDAGIAIDLHSFIEREIYHRDLGVGKSSPQVAYSEEGPIWGGYGFGLNKPTPLGIAVDGLIEASSAPQKAS
jgi:hypothetical protein